MPTTEKDSILLIDDLPDNLLVLETVLEELGCNLFKATSAQEALKMMLKQQFDLVLLDVQMPDMDGFELAELLKKKQQTKDIPIIMITAISKEQKYIRKGYAIGAENYLFKPIDPEILRQKVKTALELYHYKKKWKSAM